MLAVDAYQLLGIHVSSNVLDDYFKNLAIDFLGHPILVDARGRYESARGLILAAEKALSKRGLANADFAKDLNGYLLVGSPF